MLRLRDDKSRADYFEKKCHELMFQNQRLREALEWYANSKNWMCPTDEQGVVIRGYADADIDSGQRARKALEAREGEE